MSGGKGLDARCVLPGFLDKRRRTRRYALGFAGAGGDVAGWQARLAARWLEALPPPGDAVAVRAEGERVTLRFASGAEAQGCLRLPTGGSAPYPAVLLLHDHGGAFELGWRKLFDGPESAAGLARHYGGLAPADVFRDAGFAVLCLDALGWGGRQTGGYEAQQALAANLMHLGWSLAGIVAAEDVAAAGWLAGRPEIDAARIGAFGFSYGGFRTWQVAALSPHVRAAASVGWMARRGGLMRAGAPLLAGQSAFYMLHPGVDADFPDLAGLAAPRAIFLRSGLEDRHMPADAVAGAYEDLARIWQAAGGPPPDAGFCPGGHVCPPDVQQAAAGFLAAALA